MRFIVLALSCSIIFSMYVLYITSTEAKRANFEFLDQSMDSVQLQLKTFLGDAYKSMEILEVAEIESLDFKTDYFRIERIALEIMKHMKHLEALSIGYDDGNFLMVLREDSGNLATNIIFRDSGRIVSEWFYRDESGAIQYTESIQNEMYDHRTREWYKTTQAEHDMYWSHTFDFFHTDKIGIAVCNPFYKDDQFEGVYSVQIDFDALSEFTKSLKITDNSKVVVINRRSEEIGFETFSKDGKLGYDESADYDVDNEIVQETFRVVDEKNDFDEKFKLKIAGEVFYVKYFPLYEDYNSDYVVGLIIPEEDFLAGITHALRVGFITTLAMIIMGFLFYFFDKHESAYKSVLENKATKDPLTQLDNRFLLQSKLEAFIQDKKQVRFPVSVILCDIDRFKSINDTYGHDVGDEVLKRVAEILRTKSRSMDHPGRWGGEEFIILSENATAQDAVSFAELLRQRLEDMSYADLGIDRKITMSFGVSQMEVDGDFDAAVKLADEGLYKAKRNGRNRVERVTDTGAN